VGLEHEIGSLEIGKKADIVLMHVDQAHQVPLHRLPSVLVYQSYGTEVDTVIIDGQVRLEGRRVAGMSGEAERSLLEDAQAASDRIVHEAGMDGIAGRGWSSISPV